MSPDDRPRRRRGPVLRLAWAALLLLLLLGLARTFLVGVYRVDSGSMEPYLHGSAEEGEWVLVRYLRRPRLERFDPVVILRSGEREPVVKRAAGLPRETVQVSAGDLLVDGRRLPPRAPRPAPVPVYDERLEPLDEAFQLAGEWTREPAAWRVVGPGDVPAPDASASWGRKLLDGRLDARGRPIGGHVEVGDAILELDLLVERACGRFGARLTEEGDRFELTLEPGADGRLRASLLRRAGRAAAEPLAQTDLAFEPGGWQRLRLSNIDNHLTLELPAGRVVLEASYEANTPLGGVPDPSYRNLMPRVAFWVSGTEARVRGVRILRDLAYTDRGEHGVSRPLTLGPDELFVLGDNSSESLDSRDQGPVHLDEVVGLPVAVVWPPSGWRRLLPASRRPSQGP